MRPFSGIEWIETLKKKIEALSFDVEDIVERARVQEKTLDVDPGDLEALEERLSTIYRLKEKYGKTHGSIGDFRDSAQKRLEELLNLKTDLAALEEEQRVLQTEVEERAARLSTARTEGADRIEGLVIDELLLPLHERRLLQDRHHGQGRHR